MHNLLYDALHDHCLAQQSHFHMKGCAPGLVLKQTQQLDNSEMAYFLGHISHQRNYIVVTLYKNAFEISKICSSFCSNFVLHGNDFKFHKMSSLSSHYLYSELGLYNTAFFVWASLILTLPETYFSLSTLHRRFQPFPL